MSFSIKVSALVSIMIGGAYLSAAGDALAEAPDDPLLTMVIVDELEYRDADDGDLLAWTGLLRGRLPDPRAHQR